MIYSRDTRLTLKPAASRLMPVKNLNNFGRSDLVWLSLMAGTVLSLTVLNFSGEIEVPSEWQLGAISLSPFGLFVAIDLMFAFHLLERWARIFDLPFAPAIWVGVIAAVSGLLGSHIFSLVFYYPELMSDWRAWLDLRVGMSSFGGLITGGLAAMAALRIFAIPILSGLDALAYAFVGGYVFGRAGCFLIHDHPGTTTDFFLGSLIDDQVLHDLGFYEMWLMFVILMSFHWCFRKSKPTPGSAMALFFVIYAPIRFTFDFLRVNDRRYLDLTPGQWAAVAMLGLAMAWWFAHRRTPRQTR